MSTTAATAASDIDAGTRSQLGQYLGQNLGQLGQDLGQNQGLGQGMGQGKLTSSASSSLLMNEGGGSSQGVNHGMHDPNEYESLPTKLNVRSRFPLYVC